MTLLKSILIGLVATAGNIAFVLFLLFIFWLGWVIKPVRVEGRLMTRPEVQMALRQYNPDLVVDGEIGSQSNAAWLEYEKDNINNYSVDLINRMGGINGGTK